MWREFWMFIPNVIEHWAALLTGGVIAFSIFMYEHRKQEAISWRILVTILGVALFISCFLAWHDEHANSETMIKEKSQAYSDLGTCRANLQSETTRADVNDQAVHNAQSNLNTCMAAIGKNIPSTSPRITLLEDSVDTNTNRGAFTKQLIALTDKTITPIRLRVMCGKKVNVISAHIAGAGIQMGGSSAVFNDRYSDVNIGSPAWGPTSPLIITIKSDQADTGQCGIQMM